MHDFFAQSMPLQYVAIILSDGLLLVAVCAYVLTVHPLRKKRAYLRTLFHDFGPATVTILFAELWKLCFPAPRPFYFLHFDPFVMTPDKMGSFPSIHVAFLAALSATLIFHHRRLGYMLLALVPLVMLGRMAIGVHWPIDVIAGAILGLAIAVASETIALKDFIPKKYKKVT